MDTNRPAVQVIDLVKRYSAAARAARGAPSLANFITMVRPRSDRSIVALDGINLKIPQGDVFGLLGPNGAGKTTLMKILSTLVLPDSGQALIQGIDVVKHPRKTSRLLQAVLAEGFGFERRLSARQNLDLYGALYGIPKREASARIDELLEFSGLSDKGDVMFQKFSTGMSRKMLVCRALLSNASILLFDEPTSGLDPISAADFRKLLRNILAKEKGKTILLSTHNLWEAQQICDRIALMGKGKVIMTGTPAEIRKKVADKITMSIHVTSSVPCSWAEMVRNLKAISGVINIEAAEEADYGEMMLTIEGTRDVNYTKIFETLSLLHLTITYLEASQPSLEEAFITLTSRGI